MSSDLGNFSNCDKVNPLRQPVPALSDGLLKIYQPGLTNTKRALKELNDKEEFLFGQIHNENLHTSEIQHSSELTELFDNMEVYKNKLINIKKEMKQLHEKSLKLKKRALRVQQMKEKEIYLKQQKEAEIKMEQDLIAKPGSSPLV